MAILAVGILVPAGIIPIFQNPILADRVRESEKTRVIKNYTLQTPRGDIAVTEIRSGTEFNRILQLPGGSVIAEAGWVNQWGEEQIRMIGPTQNEHDR